MSQGARGWVMDQLMLIGHLEAELSHCDERISNINHDMKEINTVGEAEKLTDELNHQNELAKITYQARRAVMDDLFRAFPEVDEKAWCEVKHAVTAYTLAAEIYHARDFNPSAEAAMSIMAETMALVVSKAFGFDPMNCLRCLSERLNDPEEGYEVAKGPIEPNVRAEYIETPIKQN